MNYKIIKNFIKDVSLEIPSLKTLLIIEENINKYKLKVDILSKALKRRVIEVNTILRLEASSEINERFQLEVNSSTVVRIDGDIKDKDEIKKIALIKIPTEVFPGALEIFQFLLDRSGLPQLSLNKDIDFEILYKKNN